MPTTAQAPYRHADGSNCWTVNCSRGHSNQIAKSDFAKEWFDQNLTPAPAKPSKKNNVHPLASLFQPGGRVRRGMNEEVKFGEVPAVIKQEMDRRREYKAALTEEEKDRIAFYTQYAYIPTNAYLRGGEAWKRSVAADQAEKKEWGWDHDAESIISDMTDKANKTIKALDTALPKMKKIYGNNDPQVLYRYHMLAPGETAADLAAKHVPGQIIEDKGYTSTTRDPDLLLYMTNYSPRRPEMVAFEIVSKRGVPLYAFQFAGGVTGVEHEVLLPRNTKFKVHKVTSATYEHTYSSDMQHTSGFYGDRNNGWRTPLKKKRLTVIQLIDVTDEQ